MPESVACRLLEDVKRTRIDFQIIGTLAKINARVLGTQTIGRIARLRFADAVVHRFIPAVIPQFVAAARGISVDAVSQLPLGSEICQVTATELPFHARESERAIETRIAVEEEQFRIIRVRPVWVGRSFSVRHREKVHHFGCRCFPATAACIGRANGLFPSVPLFRVEVVHRRNVIVQCHQYGFRHASVRTGIVGKHLRPSSSVHSRVAFVCQPEIARLQPVDGFLVGLISRFPACHVIRAVEYRAGVEQFHTSLQSQCRTGSDASEILFVRVPTGGQVVRSRLQVFADKVHASLRGRTRHNQVASFAVTDNRVLHLVYARHATVHLYHQIITPRTEEIGLSEQQVLLVFGQAFAARHTFYHIVTLADTHVRRIVVVDVEIVRRILIVQLHEGVFQVGKTSVFFRAGRILVAASGARHVGHLVGTSSRIGKHTSIQIPNTVIRRHVILINSCPVETAIQFFVLQKLVAASGRQPCCDRYKCDRNIFIHLFHHYYRFY